MRRRRYILLLSLVMISIYTSTALAEQAVEYPSITSPSAYVVDQKTGEVLLTKDSSSRRAVASTTKMITALLVLEKADPEAQVTISDYVASTQGGTIGLKSGDKHKVRDLLYALMLASANDAAVALAEHIGGTEEKFAEMMIVRAKELGAVDTKFINPHGLASGDLHYSTAKDLGTIAQEVMKRSDFRDLVSTRRFSWVTSTTAMPVIIKNSNSLLDRHPLTIGIKTGYTSESGYCLVAAATKERRSVIVVVLGGASREESFTDAKLLLDWSLNRFDYGPIVKRNRRYATLTRDGKTIPLLSARTIVKLVYNGSQNAVVLKQTMNENTELPIAKGEELGVLSISYLGEEIGQVKLEAGRSVASPYVLNNISGYLQRVFSKIQGLLDLVS